MKKLFTLFITVLLLNGCTSPVKPSVSFATDFDVAVVMDEILTNFDVGMLVKMDSDYLHDAYNFSLDKVNEFIFYEGTMLSSERYAIFELKSVEDIDEFVKGCENIQNDLIKVFEEYLPEQSKIAKESRIEKKDQYVFFVCSENIDRVFELLYAQFEEKLEK